MIDKWLAHGRHGEGKLFGQYECHTNLLTNKDQSIEKPKIKLHTSVGERLFFL